MKSDNMTRVSLREAYDNKDVVAQIYAIRDTAESAEDSAEQAVTTANTASDHVDALVPQVEGAVASAQASAQTVAGYENRLASVESDLNAVTLRVTTAEGQIVTIQGRVTALETADGQNVKINRINDYAVGLTGNQKFSGVKTTTEFFRKEMSVKPSETHAVDAQNFVQIISLDHLTVYGYLYFKVSEDNQTQWVIGVRNRDGTVKEQALLTSD